MDFIEGKKAQEPFHEGKEVLQLPTWAYNYCLLTCLLPLLSSNFIDKVISWQNYKIGVFCFLFFFCLPFFWKALTVSQGSHLMYVLPYSSHHYHHHHHHHLPHLYHQTYILRGVTVTHILNLSHSPSPINRFSSSDPFPQNLAIRKRLVINQSDKPILKMNSLVIFILVNWLVPLCFHAHN